MAGETIALQAGQNIPAYGPDFNALANAQRTAVYVQQAQQQVQADNALRAFYSDPSNFDMKTGQPDPAKMNVLGSVSPLAMQHAQKNFLDFQTRQQQAQNFKSENVQRWVKMSNEGAEDIYATYAQRVKNGIGAKTANDMAAKEYDDLFKGLVSAGMPPELQQMWNRSWDPQRISGNMQMRKQMLDLEKGQVDLKKSEKDLAYGGYKPTDVQTSTGPQTIYTSPDPNQPPRNLAGGIVPEGARSSVPARSKPDEQLIVDTPDQKNVPAFLGPDNQYRDQAGKPLSDVTNPRHIGASTARELSPSKEIAVLDKEGNVVGRMAARESTTKAGEWVRSDDGKPVDIPEGGRIDVGQAANAVMLGGREGALLQRQLGAGIQAVRAINDVVQMPSGATSGFFAGRGQAPGLLNAAKETLTNGLTSQEVQAYNALMPGLSRSLAFIDSQGLQPGVKFTDTFNQEMLKENDTVQTKMLKLARQREIVDAGMETLLTNNRIGPEQKAAARKVMADLEKSVPWTPSDVIRLMVSGKPDDTLKSMGVKELGKGGSSEGGGSSASGPPASVLSQMFPPGTADGTQRQVGNKAAKTIETWELRGGKPVKVGEQKVEQ